MALRFIESFDTGATDKWDTCPGSLVAGGRNGNGYDMSGSAKKTLDAQTTWIIGLACKTSQVVQLGTFLEIQDAAGASHLAFIYDSGPIYVMDHDGVTLGTTSVSFTADEYIYVEIKAFIDDTGTVEVRFNETPVMSLTGVDTKSAAVGDAVKIVFPDLANFIIDDIYICDGTGSNNNDFLGDCYVTCVLPNGSLSPDKAEWKSSVDDGQSVHENVDTAEPDTSPYNYDTSGGNVTDIWEFTDIAAADDIYGVQVSCRAEAEDSDSTVAMHNVCRIGGSAGTEYDSASYNLTTAYTYHSNVWEQNPDTSMDWDKDTINAAEFGYEREVAP